MSERALRDIVNDMRIPVHPNYDFEQDSGTLDYVNPVLLNNKLTLNTNLMIELELKHLAAQEQLTSWRRIQRTAGAELATIRSRVLSEREIPPLYTKNLALTEAFVRARVLEESKEQLAQYDALVGQQHEAELHIERLQAVINATSRVVQLAELACKNIQTSLSYVKKEQEWSRHG